MKKKPKLPVAHIEYGVTPLCNQRGKMLLMTEEQMMKSKVRCCKKCAVIWGNCEIA